MIISDALRKEMERDIAQCEECDDRYADRLVTALMIKYAPKANRFCDIVEKADEYRREIGAYYGLSIISESFRMMLVDSEEELTCSHPLAIELPSAASMEAELQVQDNTLTQSQETNIPPAAGKPRVFIVHGHDDAAKLNVALTLQRAGFEPIILHEQASKGQSIIGKIETYTDVCFAVVLYTPCDLGRAKEDTQERPRARQNVVLEHGYLMAKLGRDHVCALVKDDVELPGDMSGVVYIPMSNDGGWKLKLATEMNAVGLNFDLNTLL